jgi:hypothetical protein
MSVGPAPSDLEAPSGSLAPPRLNAVPLVLWGSASGTAPRVEGMHQHAMSVRWAGSTRLNHPLATLTRSAFHRCVSDALRASGGLLLARVLMTA